MPKQKQKKRLGKKQVVASIAEAFSPEVRKQLDKEIEEQQKPYSLLSSEAKKQLDRQIAELGRPYHERFLMQCETIVKKPAYEIYDWLIAHLDEDVPELEGFRTGSGREKLLFECSLARRNL